MKKLLVLFLIGLFTIFTSCSVNSPEDGDTTDSEVPQQPVPNDNSVDQSLALLLKWDAQKAEQYDVYFGTDPDNLSFYKTTQKPEIVVTGLNYSTKYYWKVVNHLSGSETKSGKVWNFTTVSQGTSVPGYILIKHNLYTELPNRVNIMFQVLNFNSKGIYELDTDDFEVYEDGSTISPTESDLTIKNNEEVDYTQRIILMLDNSKSVENDIQQIKDASKAFIDNLSGNQEVAIYKFSEDPVLVQDFTSSKSALKSTIDAISVGYATTDLYGSVIEASNKYEEYYDVDKIVQSAIVLFTDGSDTQASHSFNEAIDALGLKRCYTVGLGNEIDPTVLRSFGNAGFYSINDIKELTAQFVIIQSELEDFANSFYWLHYNSPKRGDFDHTIKLMVKNNQNQGTNSYIEGGFSSSGFFSIDPGIYINSTVYSPEGIDTVYLSAGSSQEVFARTYLLKNESVFNWSSANANVARAIPIDGYSDYSHVNIQASSVAQIGDETIITIKDTRNSVNPKKLKIIIN